MLNTLKAMRSNPTAGWAAEDIERLCCDVGLNCRRPSTGSHQVISSPHVEGILTIPCKMPIKPLYVMLLLELAQSDLELR